MKHTAASTMQVNGQQTKGRYYPRSLPVFTGVCIGGATILNVGVHLTPHLWTDKLS